jgi:nucleotide-binding universal stress UspA family protein
MSPFKTILHPTDFSVYSAEAFRLACSLASTLKARLLLLHVNEPPAVVGGEMYPFVADLATPPQILWGQLEKLESAFPGVEVERYLVDGSAASEIVRFAGLHRCDLIVLGTHGRTGIGRMLLGSIAEEAVRKAPCPVLTVKPHFAEPVPAKAEEMAAAGA